MSNTSFPSGPTNGQQETIGGITYEYSSANGVWLRVLPSGGGGGPGPGSDGLESYTLFGMDCVNTPAPGQRQFSLGSSTLTPNSDGGGGFHNRQNLRFHRLDDFAQEYTVGQIYTIRHNNDVWQAEVISLNTTSDFTTLTCSDEFFGDIVSTIGTGDNNCAITAELGSAPISPVQNGFAGLTGTSPIQVTLSNANRDADISIDLTLINGLP